MEVNNNRRDFIKKTALGATGLALGFSAKSYRRIAGANDRVNMAVIGLNGRGKAHISAINQMGSRAMLTALCEVDQAIFDQVGADFPSLDLKDLKTYADFRKILEDRQTDAITIAAPDHWHTPMALLAMQAGKHVYLEKPCCHNPREGEWLIASQKKEGKVLQIGNQQRSGPATIQAIGQIREGRIGEVYFAKAWYSNNRGSIGKGKEAPIPQTLDWELWQGPAPRMPYRDNYVHYNWHWFWNWGTGEVNNNGLHELDICRWAMDVDYPTRTTSVGGRYHFEDDWEFYDTQLVNFDFGDKKLITWEGKSCNGLEYFQRGRGSTIHGTKGSILIDRNGYVVYDLAGRVLEEVKEEKMSATTDTVGIGNLDILHMENFLEAIRQGAKLNSPVEEGNRSNLLCHLGNMAQELGRPVLTDPSTGSLIRDPEAEKMWGRTYEQGWEPKV